MSIAPYFCCSKRYLYLYIIYMIKEMIESTVNRFYHPHNFAVSVGFSMIYYYSSK